MPQPFGCGARVVRGGTDSGQPFSVLNHLPERDKIRDDRRGGKEGAGVGADDKKVEDPGNKGAGHENFEADRVLDVHKQDVDNADEEGQKAEVSLCVEADGQKDRDRDKEDLHRLLHPVAVADNIPHAGDDVVDGTGDGTEKQHADGLHAELYGLHCQNFLPVADGAACNLHHGGEKINDIGDDDGGERRSVA